MRLLLIPTPLTPTLSPPGRGSKANRETPP